MRAFVALELDGEILDELMRAMNAFERFAENLRFCAREKLHLTLKFLGEVDDSILPVEIEILHKSGKNCMPFNIELSQCGVFPSQGRARVVWAGLNEKSGQLQMLCNLLDETLLPLGFTTEDRKFTPHITLARTTGKIDTSSIVKRVGEVKLKIISQRITNFVLMKSQLGKNGSNYEVIESFLLAPNA